MDTNAGVSTAGQDWVRKKVPVWGTIGGAFSFAAKNFRLFFLIMLSGQALQALAGVVPVNTYPILAIITAPLSLGGLFMSLWANVAIIAAMAKIYYKQETGFKDSFGAALGKIWPYVVNSFLMGLISFFGTILLIIPGIYFSVIYSLVPVAVIVEDHKAISPFKMSAALIKRYFWTVVLYALGVFVTMLPLIIAAGVPFFYFFAPLMKDPESIKAMEKNPIVSVILLVVYIAGAAIMPFFHSINFMLYAKLRDAKQGSKELSNPEALKPKLNGCLTVILLVILVMALALTFYFISRGLVPHK